MPVTGGDAAVAAALTVAEAQHGVVSAAQLAACGLSERQVRRLVEVGWLRRVRRGAYAIGGRPPSRWEEATAAALAAPCEVALSHATAAAIHRLPMTIPTGRVEMTVVRPAHPRLGGVVVHTVTRLPADQVILKNGVRLTTPARTLVDLASRVSPVLLAKMVDEGCIDRLWTVEELDAAVRSFRRIPPGARHLRAVLAQRADEGPVGSVLELEVVRALEPLAPFETQHQVVLDGQVLILDIAWPAWKVGVETDGWRPRQGSRGKFDTDRRKANLLAAHGWTVIHATSAMSAGEILSAVVGVLPPGAVPAARLRMAR